MGGYYLAYLKVNKDSREAKEIVAKQLEVLESAMREGCIGKLLKFMMERFRFLQKDVLHRHGV